MASNTLRKVFVVGVGMTKVLNMCHLEMSRSVYLTFFFFLFSSRNPVDVQTLITQTWLLKQLQMPLKMEM